MDTPRLFVAGAGSAAGALALALARDGWPLGEIATRSVERSEQRCRLLGGGEPTTLDEMATPDRMAPAEPVLLLIGVPDRHIAPVAKRLAKRRWAAGSAALHLSGSVEVSALAPLARAGVSTGGLHPLKSFVDTERDLAGLPGTVFALEGDGAAMELAEEIAERLGARPFRLEPGTRPAWHAAATHACNHFVALVDQSLDLMETAGLDRESARAALLPLLDSTLRNLDAHTPADALTGPIVRGDIEAVQRHLDTLHDAPDDVGAAYRALARRLVRLARGGRDLDPETAAALLDALAEPDA
ncbi:MAG: Rossmann-like and DUF2520 domain-containing protein [Planctomycetota bacterium]